MSEPYEIILYTYHACPFTHRVHIALQELGLKYQEINIDLDKPREPWYLDINPRGLVPAMRMTSPQLLGEHVLTESLVITQFLADIIPGRLAPPSSTPIGAIYRARLNFFVDTWTTKIANFMWVMFRTTSAEARETLAQEWVAAVRKEIEPLLEGAKPYFGGSEKMTLAEVNIAPFIIRIYALSNGDLLPKSLVQGLDSLPNFKAWAAAIQQEPNVHNVWDAELFAKRTKERMAKMRAVTPNKSS